MSKENKPKTMNDIREIYGLPRIEDNIKYDDYWERVQEKDKEIERLTYKILTLKEIIRKANNNIIKDIAMIKTHEMVKQEIVQRLIETSRILESGSDKE